MSAARIAGRFKIDPLTVLRDRDDLAWSVRVAAYQVLINDEKAAAAAQRAQPRTGRVGGSTRRPR